VIHESLNNLQTKIETLLTVNEVQFKSVRVAHYREASYFAFDGSYVYVIIDCPFSGSPEICYVGETSNLGPTLRAHARNHRFSHAFVVDLGEMGWTIREFAKDLLSEKLDPIFQSNYYPFERYRTNNFQREFSTHEVAKWIECRSK
jgi:hypothetical protein